MEIAGKHVLVTGGAKRLGRGLVEFFVQQGAKVSAHYHRTPFSPLQGAESFQADLRRSDAPSRLVAQARKAHGPVDIVIHSASFFAPVRSADCTFEQWEAALDLNLRAAFFLLQASYPDLKQRKGCIVNLCDVHVSKPLKHFAPYIASKGGLWSLTRTLASEWAPEVRVNSVSPGAVLVPEDFSEEQTQRAADRCAMKRVGSVEDVVQAANFLVRNDYVTGFDLKVDGGMF